MEERRWDGEVELTGRATSEQVQTALVNPANEVVAIHRPGSRVERWVKGKRQVWEAQDDGAWMRVDRRDVTEHRERLP